MWLKLYFLLAEAITKDGGISLDYAFNVVMGICGALITFFLGFFLNHIYSTLKSLTRNFSEFKDEFHEFVSGEGIKNENFKVRIEQLEKKIK